jgi:hypothetical protein
MGGYEPRIVLISFRISSEGTASTSIMGARGSTVFSHVKPAKLRATIAVAKLV